MAQQIRIQSIPRQYQGGFIKIRDMVDEELRELLSALDEAPLLINADALAERLAIGVEAISRDDISDVLLALLSTYSLREEYNISTSEVAAAIARTMQESSSENLRLSDNQRKPFEERLVALLSSGRLDLLGKASSLTQEQEHFMREARILTDIRPIFASNPSDLPSGAVIVHTLKLTYSDDDNQLRDFYVAVDAADIQDLRDSLERAEEKASSLKSMLEAARVPFIDLK